MVKNTKGGSKHKSKASKFAKPTIRPLRKSENEYEIYAVITEIYGGSHCLVKCIDNVERMLCISKKFRYERIEKMKYCLIGIREWQSQQPNKLEKCDLLELYTQSEKEELLRINGNNWNILTDLESSPTLCVDNNDIIFSNKEEDDVKYSNVSGDYKIVNFEENKEEIDDINFDEI